MLSHVTKFELSSQIGSFSKYNIDFRENLKVIILWNKDFIVHWCIIGEWLNVIVITPIKLEARLTP